MGPSLIWATVEIFLIHWTDLVQVKLMFWIYAEEQPEDLLAWVPRGFTLTHEKMLLEKHKVVQWHSFASFCVLTNKLIPKQKQPTWAENPHPGLHHHTQGKAMHTHKKDTAVNTTYFSEPFDPHYFPVVCVCMHIWVHWCSPVAILLKDNQSCATNWFWVQYTLCSVNS